MRLGRAWRKLGLWQGWFCADPAGFIETLPEPWRTLGLIELAIAAWASSPVHAALRPAWRFASIEKGRTMVAAFDANGEFLAATESSPGAPGLLRLRGPAARVVAHAYGAGEVGEVRLGPWNGWRAYQAARRAGAPMARALQAAWPPAGPRYLGGGARPFASPAPQAYHAWIARNPPKAVGPGNGPVFVIETPLGDEASLESVRAQSWPHWRLASAGPAAPGEIALSLGPGDRLAQDALAALAQVLADPEVGAVYADEDRLDAAGRRTDPVFKTAFDPERLKDQDYIGGAIARRIGGEAGAIAHLPQVLWHRRTKRSWPVAPPPNLPTGPLPRVLAIVPTRDRPDLLRGCVAGLLERTAYPRLELCVVDNGSVDPEALNQLDALAVRAGVRVLRIEGAFDYPGLNNAAAASSDADVLAFINDDTWVIEPDWLVRMAVLAARPDVGAVGAKLFYPDGRIQHAGVTLGLGALGVAGHGFRGAPGDLDGPQNMLRTVRQVSAVTGACLVVAREKFAAVGGFDPTFQVAFNDVDLCLRLGERGWKTIWTPHARLVHLEGATRGRDATPERMARLAEEASRMRERWGARLGADPFYHPALYLAGERFALGDRLRGDRPR